MSKEEQPKIMSVDSLVALCYILDDYKKLDESIKTNLTEKNSIKTTNDLVDISHNPRKVGGKAAREIYSKNKYTIDTINRYSNISSFLYYNDNWHRNVFSKRDIEFDLDYFYEYILNNRDKLTQIRSVLKRIKKLGINNLELDENLDFRDNIYTVNPNFSSNDKIYYLDNIVIIPNYDHGMIKYKTIDSPYEITTQPENYTNDFSKGNISKYNIDIKLNSFVFDKNRLPDKITRTTTFERITYLRRWVTDACNSVRNYVDLSIDVDKFKDMYNDIVNDLINTEDIDNKESIHIILRKISNNIQLLEAITNGYKEKIVDNTENVKSTEIEREKEDEKVLRKKIIRGNFINNDSNE